ncbi:MAG: transporter [Reyranella sp.]|nr:transporter [Reyranella sp.]
MPAPEARADEGGSGYWLPGSFAWQAAVPSAIGFTIETAYYHATQSTDPSLSVSRGNNLIFGLYTSSNFLMVTPTYAMATPGIGGQLELSLTFQMGNYTAADAGTTIADSMTAMGDLSPAVAQKWVADAHNFMAYAAGNIPVGSYDPSRLATTGLGHWAVDGGLGYTYYDDKSGREFSAVLGLTYNFMNPSTAYQSGIDLHLDLSASQALNDSFYAGVVGYIYNQISGDTGSGATLGAFPSRVVGVGPQVGYNFSLGGRDVQMNARAYYEVAGQNRPVGWNAWLTFTIALAKSEK